jgi:hypothetical protein
MQPLSDAANHAVAFINQTRRSVFLTGKAGTGKTTLLKTILETTHKRTVVVAPTGIAALNAGGVTIHSMFQLPFASFIPDANYLPDAAHIRAESPSSLRRHFKQSGLKQAVLRSMDLLVIDEVSMLRPDLLDAVDYMLQFTRKNKLPFGGVQVLYIGDLMQLPPVIRNEEWNVLKAYYTGKFFFHAQAVAASTPVVIELTHIYRQSDQVFIEILNNLRNNVVTTNDLGVLNQFVNPAAQPENGWICLTTHNAKADTINSRELARLTGKECVFEPEITGDFPERLYPIEPQLRLKDGAQVMFIKNDLSPEKRYYNGRTGTVCHLSADEIRVTFPDTGETLEVERYEWQNIRYVVDDKTREIREEVIGTFVQYPLKLAWAITVHKSQGLTFERAILDVSDVFMPGQAYVALSRIRSLEGLVLLSPMRMNGISSDEDAVRYADSAPTLPELQQTLSVEARNHACESLVSAFDFTGLVQGWSSFVFSLSDAGNRSQKSDYKKWADHHLQTVQDLIADGRKFGSFLRAVLSTATPDHHLIEQRVIAAKDYFAPILERASTALLEAMRSARSQKKAKAFLRELTDLEELHTESVLRIHLAVRWAELFASNVVPTKSLLQRESLTAAYYDRVKSQMSPTTDFIDSSYQLEQTSKKRDRQPKEKKKSTYLITYEMWQQTPDVGHIATQRVLSEKTILSHLAKLVEIKAIPLDQVLPAASIQTLSQKLGGIENQTLSQLKEIVGDEFSFEELKIFRAAQLKEV